MPEIRSGRYRRDKGNESIVLGAARLQEAALVVTERYRPIQLTEKGKKLATASRERHEIVYRFLLAIGIDAATAAIDAEGIEHHVSPRTLKRFGEIARAGQLT